MTFCSCHCLHACLSITDEFFLTCSCIVHNGGVKSIKRFEKERNRSLYRGGGGGGGGGGGSQQLQKCNDATLGAKCLLRCTSEP